MQSEQVTFIEANGDELYISLHREVFCGTAWLSRSQPWPNPTLGLHKCTCTSLTKQRECQHFCTLFTCNDGSLTQANCHTHFRSFPKLYWTLIPTTAAVRYYWPCSANLAPSKSTTHSRSCSCVAFITSTCQPTILKSDNWFRDHCRASLAFAYLSLVDDQAFDRRLHATFLRIRTQWAGRETQCIIVPPFQDDA